jgi:hypothetical protein
MKSKVTTYILIVLAIVVWGTIAKKLFFPTHDFIDKKSERPLSSTKQNAIGPLLLNYRDPFLSKKDQPSITTPKNFTTSHSQIKKIEENNVHFRYLGMFSYGNQKRYIIEINGAQHVIEQGDCINNYKLRHASLDSVLFENGKQTYWVKRSL